MEVLLCSTCLKLQFLGPDWDPGAVGAMEGCRAGQHWNVSGAWVYRSPLRTRCNKSCLGLLDMEVLESVGGLFIRIHWDPGAGDTTGVIGAGRPWGELGVCI